MPLNVDLNAEAGEDLFYYYHNWQAGQPNLIHKGECLICRWGTGMHQNVNRGAQGVWIGPFSSVELIHQYVNEYFDINPGVHNCV